MMFYSRSFDTEGEVELVEEGSGDRRSPRSAVSALARPGEVFDSSTVKDLVAGPASR